MLRIVVPVILLESSYPLNDFVDGLGSVCRGCTEAAYVLSQLEQQFHIKLKKL